MLTMRADLSAAVRDLDRVDRALLSLTVRRGVPDEVVAEITRTDPADVARRRAAAIVRLAAAIGCPPEGVAADLAALPAEAWQERGAPGAQAAEATRVRAVPAAATTRVLEVPALAAAEQAEPAVDLRPEPVAEQPVEPVAEQPDEPVAEPPVEPVAEQPAAPPEPAAPTPAEPPDRRRSPLAWVALAALSLAAVLAVVALASGGGSGEETRPAANPGERRPAADAGDRPPARKPAGARAAPPRRAPAARRARFERVSAGARGARGTIELRGDRLHVELRGLPPLRRGERYEVWLYDSVMRARSLATARGSGGRRPPGIGFTALAPPRRARWDAVDVSREPRDGNPNHSGASVVRARLPR
jgi:hypothetical protein